MIIYTDGACQGNGKAQNSGGYGFVVVDENDNFIDCVAVKSENTTNNREELKAILDAFFSYGVKQNIDFVLIPTVYSDSNYCVRTFNEWMWGWEKNGWINSKKKTPENLDLIMQYYDWYKQGYRINLQKIAGHRGHKWNEIADQLATGKITPEEVKKLYVK